MSLRLPAFGGATFVNYQTSAEGLGIADNLKGSAYGSTVRLQWSGLKQSTYIDGDAKQRPEASNSSQGPADHRKAQKLARREKSAALQDQCRPAPVSSSPAVWGPAP